MIIDLSGEGEPMVMIHGFGGTSTTFHPFIEPNKRFWSIRPDLPVAGRSPLLPENLTIASLTAAVLALLDRLQIACAHFVDHSMGSVCARPSPPNIRPKWPA